VGSRYLKANLADIANQYGLKLYHIKPYDTLYKKNAVYRVSTNKGKFLIKEFSRRTLGTKLSKEQQRNQLSTYIKKLKDCRYPNFAKWLTTNFGQYYVIKNGRPYYMTEWIEGRRMKYDVQEYEALGRALANLHSICKDCRSSRFSFIKRQIKLFKYEDRLFQLRLTSIQKKKTFAKRWFQKHGDQCGELANEAWKIIGTPEVKRIISKERKHPAFIHGDVTIPNIVFNSSGMFLIDWDCLRMGSTYNEIAKTLSNTTYYNPVHIDALLRGYNIIKPLNSAERLLISALFRLPREAWSEAKKIVLNRSHRGFRVLEQTWNDRLNAIRWLDEWARQLPPVTDVT
jgi:Ser/Thr protein kinase RdoA (MazF antagonist)